MHKKIARLSYNQLVLLQVFLRSRGEIVSVSQLARQTPLQKKVLGGVLSSLSRTKFRGNSLIEPMGKARDGVGLRWKLNTKLIELEVVKKEVNRLVASY